MSKTSRITLQPFRISLLVIFRGGESSQTDIARIRVHADQDFSPGSSATKMIFETTPSGSTADGVALTIDSSQQSTFNGNINLPDDIALSLGSGTDAQIWNNGSQTNFRNNTSNQDFVFMVNDNLGDLIN